MTPAQLEMTAELGAALDVPTDAQELLALAAGIHEGVPERVYHARVLGMASKGALDQLRKSPAHYRAWVAGLIDRHSPALHLGRAVHAALLEPDRFAREYVVAPDFGDCRKRENKLARDKWNRAHRGATILRHEDGRTTLAMITALAAHPTVTALFEGARVEVTARWDEGAVPCKARADLVNAELCLLADVKSTEDASPIAFGRSVWNYGYHRQADWYLRGFRACGVPVEAFVFIGVEKAPPHAVALYELDERARARGRAENDALLWTLADCVERDRWPGYAEGIEPLSLPRWAEKA